ncbi:MAG: nucleoside monophosphate kinase [Planctomycetota bacterium]|nr:nucleoside monophosphate kinase [Planctomycetota bacterium]MDA1215197.1 nucleoside monophosphate kinase [Planctomycetota bacterium]
MADKQKPAVLLFGAPGVGKGTQGRILGTIPGFFHLSCGDVFRSLDIGSELGQKVYEFSSQGRLVPDEMTINIWRHGLQGQIGLTSYKPREDLLVLDGIPRNVNQAKMLEEDVRVLRVIYLVCSDEIKMIHRIKRRAIHENRADDANEEVIRHRFKVYRDQSEPVLNHYPSEIISRIEATASPAQVLRDILDVLIPTQDEHFKLNLKR